MSVLLVDAGPVGFRLGLTDQNGDLHRLHHEFAVRKEARLGEVYRAKVHTRDQRLGGVFCVLDDLGMQGFLAIKDKAPRVGETILVGVKREAIGTKACQLVANPSLRLPGATVRDTNEGLTIAPGPLGEFEDPRTGALADEMFDGSAIGLAASVPPLLRAVMGFLSQEVEEVRATEPETAAMLRGWLEPSGLPVAAYDHEAVRAPLDDAEDDALLRVSSLAGGGRVVFDEAEALTAIDVDTGGRDARSAKGAQEAVAAALLSVIGRQASLRSLGGQIVLDLPRRAFASPKVLRDRLTKAFGPVWRVSIPAVTNEGVVVVIAPRSGPSLLERLTEPYPGVDGDVVMPGRRLRADVVAMRAARMLEAALIADRSAQLTLTCPARARAYIDDAVPTLTERYGARISIETEEGTPNVR